MRLLAVPLYRGEPTYEAYLIRPNEGNGKVFGWADLKGKVFAYSDPLSNSGWLVAQGELASLGCQLGLSRRAFFAHGHRNVAEAVAARPRRRRIDRRLCLGDDAVQGLDAASEAPKLSGNRSRMAFRPWSWRRSASATHDRSAAAHPLGHAGDDEDGRSLLKATQPGRLRGGQRQLSSTRSAAWPARAWIGSAA